MLIVNRFGPWHPFSLDNLIQKAVKLSAAPLPLVVPKSEFLNWLAVVIGAPIPPPKGEGGYYHSISDVVYFL
jgi:hypothetical protein